MHLPDPPPGRTVYRERRFALRCCRLPLRGGHTEERAVVIHPGAVVLLPVLDDGRLVLIRNHRWQLGHPARGCRPAPSSRVKIRRRALPAS